MTELVVTSNGVFLLSHDMKKSVYTVYRQEDREVILTINYHGGAQWERWFCEQAAKNFVEAQTEWEKAKRESEDWDDI